MKTRSWMVVFVALGLSSLACSLTIPVPPTDITVGPTRSQDILVDPVGDAGEKANLTLSFGAGRMMLQAGEEGALVQGTATYNVADLAPEVSVEGTSVEIDQGDLHLEGVPDLRGSELVNQWDLALGMQEMDLRVNAGAYEGEMELGGLRLANLHVSDGVAKVRLSFSRPNLVPMEQLRYDTGASDVQLVSLANAGFAHMVFSGGAGSYVLDYSGDLARPATVRVDVGLCSLRIVVPEGTAAQLKFDGGLANIELAGGWRQEGALYVHPGEGPMLAFDVRSGVGNLSLEE